MKKRLLFILCLVLGLNGFLSAQNKTVTNTDLEKFRQKRLQAERDYDKNAERLGFPTARELAERNKQNVKELIEFSEQLRAERLENERIELLQEQISAAQTPNGYLPSANYSPPVERNYYYGYSPFGFYGGYSSHNYGRGNYYNHYWRNYNDYWRNHYQRKYWGNQMPPIRPPRPIRPSFPLNYKPYYPPKNHRRK